MAFFVTLVINEIIIKVIDFVFIIIILTRKVFVFILLNIIKIICNAFSI